MRQCGALVCRHLERFKTTIAFVRDAIAVYEAQRVDESKALRRMTTTRGTDKALEKTWIRGIN